MTRFVVGDDRSQSTLFPDRLDDYVEPSKAEAMSQRIAGASPFSIRFSFVAA
jgi:hypothetical protein